MRSPPEIETSRLILRRISRYDAEDMYDYSRDADVTKYLTWKPHPSLRYTQRYLLGIDAAYEEGRFYDWAVTLRATGKMIGTCGYTRFDFICGTVEVGYVLNPRYEGYGLMTEALLAVIDFAFRNFGAKRIEGRFMAENMKSRAVMERCLMKFEGIKSQALEYDGRRIDIGVCSVTENEWGV